MKGSMCPVQIKTQLTVPQNYEAGGNGTTQSLASRDWKNLAHKPFGLKQGTQLLMLHHHFLVGGFNHLEKY